MFRKMDEASGQLNPEKCKLAHSKVILLGHLVSENGIEADPRKVESLLLRDPTTAEELASFVHKLRHLSRFIWMSGQYVQPLQHMLWNFQNFEWSERGL